MKIAESSGGAAKDARIIELMRTIHAMGLAGEAMFALILEAGGPLTPAQLHKVEACRLLEIEMADLVYRHLVLELGIAVSGGTNPPLAVAARAAIREHAWHARMVAMEVAAAGMVAPFRELKMLYADRHPMLCNTLLAHALMIRDFAHDEAEGQADHSLSGVVSLLGADARRALERFQA